MFAKMFKRWLLIGVVASGGSALIMGCQTSHHDTQVASSSWEGGAPPLTTVPTDQPEVPSFGDRTADEHRHADVPPRTSSVARLPYGGQRTCPVSGEELGSMGDPISVAVKGQTVYVCCSGCVGKVKANPEKYLAKVREEIGGGN